MLNKKTTRRGFVKNGMLFSTALLTSPTIFNILPSQPKLSGPIIGHGDFRYRVELDWSQLNPEHYPVNNCHEMVIDSKGRIILLTDHIRNNILIFDKSGKYLSSWTQHLRGAHGLTLHTEGSEEFLYLTDYISGQVIKCTIDGQVIITLPQPQAVGAYRECDSYRPTETAIAPNGDIYVADGYGSQYILRYTSKGEFIQKFGGRSFLDQDKFVQAHGVTLDTRNPDNPTLLCTARIKNTFKRFSLDGKHLEDIYLPGAYISRAVIDGDELYSGVCFGMTAGNYNMQRERGFVTILNQHNRVISNPGGSEPHYHDDQLQLLLQKEPVFRHCHDVCVDQDKNLYVCQWNAGGVYPYKLHRL